jgi:hypothetical protein
MSSSSDSSFSNLDTFSSKWTVKSILQDYFETYLNSHTPRGVELKEVNKALSCYEKERGCFVYKCSKCSLEHLVKIGCNSRLCSSCGKRYADNWSSSLSQYLFKVPHRHVVIGIPEVLWSWLKEHRCFWKDYMDAAILTLNDIFSQMLKRDIKVGAIVVLHPFGKDINFKPHLHLIITEGGFDLNKDFVKDYFIPADTFRKKWQYHVLKVLQNCGLPNTLASQCYSKYKTGFYVWVDKAGRIKNSKTISQYIGRYIRHPAVANNRIVNYEGGHVTFYYKNPNDNDKVIFITKPVDEFIESILQHIPEPQFKMIRYYGAYSRNNVRKYKASLKQSSIEIKTFNKILKKEQLLCPKCECEMELVGFRKYEPP